MAQPFPAMGGAAPSTLATFSDGSSARTLLFATGGGWNNTTSITVPRGAAVTVANVTVTPVTLSPSGRHAVNASAARAGAASSNLSMRGENLSLGVRELAWSAGGAGFRGAMNGTAVDAAGVRLAGEMWVNRSMGPQARYDHGAGWDGGSGRMLLFGGLNITGDMQKDTWAYYPSNDTWVQLKTGPMNPTFGFTTVWDSTNNQFLIFGGQRSGMVQWDLWAYYPTNDTWVQKRSRPQKGFGHAAVWDTQNNQMLVFGGRNSTYETTNDTWAYYPSNDTWEKKANGGLPLLYHTAVWDATGNRMLVFGGEAWNGTGYSSVNDTWAYHPLNDSWVRMAGGATPRLDHAAAWDDQSGQMLVFGGSKNEAKPETNLSDLWGYSPSLDSWTYRGDAPTARWGHTAVWDNRSGQMVVFGGRSWNGTGSHFLNDTVSYHSEQVLNGTFTQDVITLPSIPSPLGPLNYSVIGPPGTSVSVSLRASTDNSTWSAWENISSGAAPRTTPPGRYIQWRASLSTADNTTTPRLSSLSLRYTLYNRTGSLVSGGIAVAGRLTAAAPHLDVQGRNGTVSIRLSADGGLHWQDAADNSTVAFSYSGSSLLYRLDLGASPDGDSPLLRGLIIDYRYENVPSGLLLGIGGDTIPVEVLSGAARVDFSAALSVFIALAGDGTGDLAVTLAIYSASAGAVNLSQLAVEYTASGGNSLPAITLISPPDGATVNRTDVNLTWSAGDADNDTLRFDVLLDGNVTASNLTLPSHTLHNLTPGASYSWQVRAYDGHGWTAGPVRSFSVAPSARPNTPPAASLVYPAGNARVNSTTVDLVWNGSDSDGDAVTYRLFLDIAGGNTPFLSLNGTSYRVTGLLNGTAYYWKVIASDGIAEAAAGPWRFIVDMTPPNRPPTISDIALPGATAGRPYAFHLTAADPDGDTLAFTLVSGPAGMTAGPDGTLRWTPGKGGSYPLSVRVSDGKANTTATFTLVVETARPAPPSPGAGMQGWLLPLSVLILGLAVVAAAYLTHRRTPSTQTGSEASHRGAASGDAGPPPEPAEGSPPATAPPPGAPVLPPPGDATVLDDMIRADIAALSERAGLLGAAGADIEHVRALLRLASSHLAAGSPDRARRNVDRSRTMLENLEAKVRPGPVGAPRPAALAPSENHTVPTRVSETRQPDTDRTGDRGGPVLRPLEEAAPLAGPVEAFLVFQDGRLISRTRTSGGVGLDGDIFSGMLTAVQQFIRDSMDGAGAINSISMGKRTVCIERGPQIFLAVIVEGKEPRNLRRNMRRALITVWDIYHGRLKRWDGTMDGMDGIKDIMREQVLKVH